ncbi:MAG: hypothetical protein FJX75_08775 [Armatimonadetes bacterium]|nr:hypothetical protein [Armatimonadota bacterium]
MTIHVAFLLATTAWLGPAQAQLPNGDFEAADARLWTRFGDGVTLRRVPAPGWTRLTSTLDTRDYSALRLYLRIQTGVGTVCFDHVGIDGLDLRNPSFEAAEGDRLVDWGQDNVGTTISVADEAAADGERCVCLHQDQSAMSRIWQDLACRPGTQHAVSLWVRTAGFRGDAYAEVYGMREGELGEIIWQSEHLSGAEQGMLGRTILSLTSEANGRGGVEQSVEVPPGRNLSLSADLEAPLLEGGRLSVGVWSADRLLGEVALDHAEGQWKRHASILQSPPDGRVTVRVQAEGPVGLAYVDNIAVEEIAEVVPAARAQFVEAERNLPLGDRLDVRLPEPVPDLLTRGIAILARRISEVTGGAVTLAAGEGEPQLTVAIDDDTPPTSPWWQADQSYVLACSEAGVRLSAPNVLGALYGLMALPGLLDQAPDGHWQLLAVRLEDAPDLPLRGAYMGGLPRDRNERLAWCERFAALRVNAVIIEDGIWWQLDNERERQTALDAFSDFRAYGIEPIPELQSFGWAHLVLAIDPMCAEGAYVERERLVLKAEEPTALVHPNVLRTESTDVVIENAQGIRYTEGRDYEVLNGETRHVYRPEAPPYRVRRLPGGRVPDGATVYASYDYVSRVNSENCPYCPSEPRVARIMTAAITNTVRYLKPAAIHLGHDEPALMNSDSRCRFRPKPLTNGELFAEDVRRLYDAAHEADPGVRVMMWEDAVNPYHNGLQFPSDPTADALPLLPRDLILNVWFYGPDEPDRQGAESLRYFGAHGFPTTGSPWYSEPCAVAWARQCRDARLRGEECLGVIYTSWGGRWDALEACAGSAWHVPRPGPASGPGLGRMDSEGEETRP